VLHSGTGGFVIDPQTGKYEINHRAFPIHAWAFICGPLAFRRLVPGPRKTAVFRWRADCGTRIGQRICGVLVITSKPGKSSPSSSSRMRARDSCRRSAATAATYQELARRSRVCSPGVQLPESVLSRGPLGTASLIVPHRAITSIRIVVAASVAEGRLFFRPKKRITLKESKQSCKSWRNRCGCFNPRRRVFSETRKIPPT